MNLYVNKEILSLFTSKSSSKRSRGIVVHNHDPEEYRDDYDDDDDQAQDQESEDQQPEELMAGDYGLYVRLQDDHDDDDTEAQLAAVELQSGSCQIADRPAIEVKDDLHQHKDGGHTKEQLAAELNASTSSDLQFGCHQDDHAHPADWTSAPTEDEEVDRVELDHVEGRPPFERGYSILSLKSESFKATNVTLAGPMTPTAKTIDFFNEEIASSQMERLETMEQDLQRVELIKANTEMSEDTSSYRSEVGTLDRTALDVESDRAEKTHDAVLLQALDEIGIQINVQIRELDYVLSAHSADQAAVIKEEKPPSIDEIIRQLA